MVSSACASFPTPDLLSQHLPITLPQNQFVLSSQKNIDNILQGYDSRKLIVVGPCSIHDLDAATEYAHLLHRLSCDVIDEFFIVMRVYLEKPRSTIGWKGFLFDPHLDGSHDMLYGLQESRKFLLNLATMGLAAGSELLELSTYHYLGDLLSWGCIGARTSSSQPHRQMVSDLTFPVGFKNPIDGNLDCLLNAVHAASFKHTFLGMNREGRISIINSLGNESCHLILRGQQEKPNYDAATINFLIHKMQKMGLDKKIMIDCSHDNCRKIYQRQEDVFRSFIDHINNGYHQICGAMLESHLFAGNQPLLPPPCHLKYGVSITDPCLDFASTERVIKEAAFALIKYRKN